MDDSKKLNVVCNGGEISSSEDESDKTEKIRIGRDFQCEIPELISEDDRRDVLNKTADCALLVWKPNFGIPDNEIDQYINVAKDQYSYSCEQALGMLFWHRYNLDMAISDLANFTPYPDEWSHEDRALFDQAFHFHGKNFHRIRSMLPDKTINGLVQYYYTMKKNKYAASVMDRQSRRNANNNNNNASRPNILEEGPSSDPRSETTSSESESDTDKKRIINRGIVRERTSPTKQKSPIDDAEEDGKQNKCSNCDVFCASIFPTLKGGMCKTCAIHFRKTGILRPTTVPPPPKVGRSDRNFIVNRKKRVPPKGMYMNHDDLMISAEGPKGQTRIVMRSMERELGALKRTVQNNKQTIAALRRDGKNVNRFRDFATPQLKAHPKWTQEESQLVVEGLRTFGKNFHDIAEVILTKSEQQIESYVTQHLGREDIVKALAHYDKMKSQTAAAAASKTADGSMKGLECNNRMTRNNVIYVAPTPAILSVSTSFQNCEAKATAVAATTNGEAKVQAVITAK